jgi:UDP-N-acetylglucosamine--N-acetylmuramyl-(pentapeptide) pyrophosphoryl-undecaprenol N-acetylglucosamine transferase
MGRTRIAYYVHGHGRGHASRALSIVPALRNDGYEVALYASGDALSMLVRLGARERPLLRPGLDIARQLARRAAMEIMTLRRERAALLIADGDQGPVIAARALRIPSLAISHDLVFSRGVLPQGLSSRHLLHQRLNGLIPNVLSTRRIAVHFLPLATNDANTRVARPEVEAERFHGARVAQLVPYFRDPNGQRVLALAQQSSLPIAPALLSGERLPRDAFRALLASAVGAVGSAGSNLIAECVLFATPLLALYEANDAEQALNAQLLAAHNLGVACSFAALDGSVLRHFFDRACRRDFATVDLAQALPSVVEVTREEVRALCGSP